MPPSAIAEVDHFVPVAPSKLEIQFAKLKFVDLSTYNNGEEEQKILAGQIRDAMTTQGFFTFVGHGLSEEEITRQVDIGHTVLKRTSQEEKERLRSPIREQGNYFGFKPRGVWKTVGKAVDNIEQFNVYRDLDRQELPEAIKPFRHEVQGFIDFTHKEILYKLLRLFALALELEDEEYFVKIHDYDQRDLSWLRWMEYYRSDDSTQGEKNLWLQGHQDLTCLTILFSQPMSSLQVRDINDKSEWKYIEHTPGGIVVNAGEIMQWFTGGYFKAAIHRVIEPPGDQKGRDRSSVFYFSVPNDDVVINTLLDQSPVLRNAGVKMAHDPNNAPTSYEWVTGRVKITGKTSLSEEGDENHVTEKVGKVTTKWFR